MSPEASYYVRIEQARKWRLITAPWCASDAYRQHQTLEDLYAEGPPR